MTTQTQSNTDINNISNDEEWFFEVKQIRAIKVKVYGQPYRALVYFNIVNKQLHLESLISFDGFTSEDFIALEDKVIELGFSEYYLNRERNGELVFERKTIKKRRKRKAA